MEQYFVDFNFFWNKINNFEKFSFARYADGEVCLMKGESVSQSSQAFIEDKWCAPIAMTTLGRHLHEACKHEEDNYYYAISALSDSQKDYLYLKDNIKSKNITFANLWINANYLKSIENFKNLKRSAHVICNSNGKTENFPFKVDKIFSFPDDCVNFWENNHLSYIENLYENFNNKKDLLVFVSCGPVSAVIVHLLTSYNNQNTYIDVGSSIDEFVHRRITRQYMRPEHEHSRFISRF